MAGSNVLADAREPIGQKSDFHAKRGDDPDVGRKRPGAIPSVVFVPVPVISLGRKSLIELPFDHLERVAELAVDPSAADVSYPTCTMQCSQRGSFP